MTDVLGSGDKSMEESGRVKAVLFCVYISYRYWRKKGDHSSYPSQSILCIREPLHHHLPPPLLRCHRRSGSRRKGRPAGHQAKIYPFKHSQQCLQKANRYRLVCLALAVLVWWVMPPPGSWRGHFIHITVAQPASRSLSSTSANPSN